MAENKAHSWFTGKLLPSLLALLCVGAIGSGISLARSVDSLHQKVEQLQQSSIRRDQAQNSRLDRHDRRILYLERQRSEEALGGPYGLDHPATTGAR